MWFPRYEQSINPLLSFHFGILTVLVNFLGRLILFHAMVTAALMKSFRIACTKYTSDVARDWCVP